MSSISGSGGGTSEGTEVGGKGGEDEGSAHEPPRREGRAGRRSYKILKGRKHVTF